jgi:acetyl-CoA decarbonylase/synthase complex subunit delta
MRAVAEEASDKRLAISPVEEGDYKAIAAACLGYNHVVVGSSPIDVNLAKQMNILLGNLGVSPANTLIDPTTGGLGYGLEYSYSIVERLTQAAMTQEDDKLQLPIISNVGNEVWKSKEANLSEADAPELGDPSKRGVMMEVITAIDMLLAGADIVIVRHPESMKLLKEYINTMLG